MENKNILELIRLEPISETKGLGKEKLIKISRNSLNKIQKFAEEVFKEMNSTNSAFKMEEMDINLSIETEVGVDLWIFELSTSGNASISMKLKKK